MLVEAEGPSFDMSRGPWREVYEPISDPLIQRCAEIVCGQQSAVAASGKAGPWWQRALDFVAGVDAGGEAASHSDVVYLPTGCLALLDILQDARPNHVLLAADFSMLPGVRLAGHNAPLVSSRVRLEIITSLLSALGCQLYVY